MWAVDGKQEIYLEWPKVNCGTIIMLYNDICIYKILLSPREYLLDWQ